MNICKVEWCDKMVFCKGYCKRHDQQIRNWGEIRRSKGDKNEIIKYEDHAEIILYDKDYNEKARTIIDLDDVEKCKPYKWVYRNDGYVSAKINGKGIKLHRFIANTPEGLHTDHENRNKLDNRKSNLKICTQSENNKNKNKYINNKTGKRGVYKEGNKYRAEIRYNGKSKYLGSFDKFDDAVKVRECAEIKYHGHILEDAIG